MSGRRARGFTLVEIAFSIAMVSIVLAILFSSLLYFQRVSTLDYAKSRALKYEGAFRSALVKLLQDPVVYPQLRTATRVEKNREELAAVRTCSPLPVEVMARYKCLVDEKLSPSERAKLYGYGNTRPLLEKLTLEIDRYTGVKLNSMPDTVKVKVTVEMSVIDPATRKPIHFSFSIKEVI